MASFDELEGMPCNVGNAGEGVIDISFAAATGGTVSMSCTPTTLHALTVVKAGTGTGTVTSNPAGISCGTDCAQEYATGREVTLTATPDGANTFIGWTGACTGSATTCTLTMNQAKDVTASFDRTGELGVTVSSERDGGFGDRGRGRVTGPGGFSCTASGTPDDVNCSRRYILGSQVTLTAIPEFGDTFIWGGACSGVVASTCTVTINHFNHVTVAFIS